MVQLDMLGYRKTGHSLVDVRGRTTSGDVKAVLATAVTEYGGITALDGGQSDGSDHASFEGLGFHVAGIVRA